MSHIRKRVVLHFPGFEPLDATEHHRRYVRSALKSAKAWNYQVETGPLGGPSDAPSFTVRAGGPDWETESRIHVLDHNGLISAMRSHSVLTRIAAGYGSAARVILYRGMSRYFRHAWRFGLFFVFPFLLVALGAAALLLAASLPAWLGFGKWNFIWTLPLAGLLFFKVFLPRAERLHTLHLFDDWRLAVAMARRNDPSTNARLEQCVEAARAAFQEEADEYLVTSHSMGASVAAHAIGTLLEHDPRFFAGKKVVFAALGGTICQCTMLEPAEEMRRHVGAIARSPEIFWLDVHCLTDAINFYRVKVVETAGFADLPQAAMVRIRFKNVLSPEHYRRVKHDVLRMHRQYVLGPDRRAAFDFTLITAGPFEAKTFATFSTSNFAPMGADGSIGLTIPAQALSEASN